MVLLADCPSNERFNTRRFAQLMHQRITVHPLGMTLRLRCALRLCSARYLLLAAAVPRGTAPRVSRVANQAWKGELPVARLWRKSIRLRATMATFLWLRIWATNFADHGAIESAMGFAQQPRPSRK